MLLWHFVHLCDRVRGHPSYACEREDESHVACSFLCVRMLRRSVLPHPNSLLQRRRTSFIFVVPIGRRCARQLRIVGVPVLAGNTHRQVCHAPGTLHE